MVAQSAAATTRRRNHISARPASLCHFPLCFGALLYISVQRYRSNDVVSSCQSVQRQRTKRRRVPKERPIPYPQRGTHARPIRAYCGFEHPMARSDYPMSSTLSVHAGQDIPPQRTAGAVAPDFTSSIATASCVAEERFVRDQLTVLSTRGGRISRATPSRIWRSMQNRSGVGGAIGNGHDHGHGQVADDRHPHRCAPCRQITRI